MNSLLERLGGFAARRHWIVIIAWLVILGGTLWARQASGGEFVNNYTVSGSGSALGLDRLNQDFPQQGGYAGQIVFHAKTGKVSDSQSAVNQATSNVAKLPDVIKAVSPFASPSSGAVSKDGTIAYSSVSWNVNPDSLDTDYLNRLDQAVAPARSAGLQVEYGGGAGQIGQVTKDLKSEVIGLACALILLLFMFGSLIAAARPSAPTNATPDTYRPRIDTTTVPPATTMAAPEVPSARAAEVIRSIPVSICSRCLAIRNSP